MGWYSIGCVFDREPDWERLDGLHTHAFLQGYRHKNGRLWLLDAGMGKRPTDYEMFTSSWPEYFQLPAGLTLPACYAEFVEQSRAVSDIVQTFSPHTLNYAAAVATLAGQRTYLWGGSDEDFDMAVLLDGSKIEAFGAEGGLMEITREPGGLRVQCTCPPEAPGETADEEALEALEALPFVSVNRAPKACEGELYRWPLRIWPEEWGDPGEVLGLGTWDYPEVWRENLEECYYRSGRPIVPPKPSLLPLLKRLLRRAVPRKPT